MKSKGIRFGLSLILLSSVSAMTSESHSVNLIVFIIGMIIFSSAEWEI